MTKAINTSTIKKKIKGFGPIYWINLDTDVERKEKAENFLSTTIFPILEFLDLMAEKRI